LKFGLFYEMYVPPADLADPGTEARIVRETVDQIVLADKRGWDYVWLTEHHFLKQFSHMSAPEVVFAAAAYVTEHIRFGFGLALTPPKYNHPVRVAERAAMLDCLSNGRVDLGSGRSTTPAELYGFGLDPDESRAQWEEGLEAVARLLAEEDVELDGQFVKMPPRTVYPRPVQQPHPPLWVGGVGPGNAERAARRGLGMLFFASNNVPEDLRESVAAYKEHIDLAQPFVEGGTNNQIAGFINGLCTTDPAERDRIRWLAATKMVEHTLHGSTFMTSGWPDPQNIPASYAHVMEGGPGRLLAAIKEDPDAVAVGMLERGTIAAGTPDDCLEVLSRFRGVGVDQVIIHQQMGGVPHADIVRSIEAFGTEVFPALR
jgi:alkanesulfonate monooxygenase SsuD/methylene tetrahydromethanopterin reductase-like flavin-dependent oxidoreductase (luciferase family)